MKAIVYTHYGPPEVLKLKEVEKPVPEENEILIKVEATAVNSGDWRLRKADPFLVRLFFGLFKPKRKILGTVLSGVVEEIGNDVRNFEPGDEVFGFTDMHLGAYAQYVCLPEDAPLARKPENLSHSEAAGIPFGAHTALYFLNKSGIRPGQKVLVYGASGAVGTSAVQLAKYFEAQVTAVCSSKNMELVKSLGADNVLDYTQPDFLKKTGNFDIIFETVNKTSVPELGKHLSQDGVLILSSAMLKESFQGLKLSLTKKVKLLVGSAKVKAEDMEFIRSLALEGKLKPVTDKIYPLEEIVEAHKYVEKGHKRGNVIIRVSAD